MRWEARLGRKKANRASSGAPVGGQQGILVEVAEAGGADVAAELVVAEFVVVPRIDSGDLAAMLVAISSTPARSASRDSNTRLTR